MKKLINTMTTIVIVLALVMSFAATAFASSLGEDWRTARIFVDGEWVIRYIPINSNEFTECPLFNGDPNDPCCSEPRLAKIWRSNQTGVRRWTVINVYDEDAFAAGIAAGDYIECTSFNGDINGPCCVDSLFTPDANWEEFFNPDNYKTLAEYNMAVDTVYYSPAIRSLSSEQLDRNRELYHAGVQVFTARETASSWAKDAIFATMDYMPRFTSYQADVTRYEFVDMLMRWVEHETGKPFISMLGFPMWMGESNGAAAIMFYPRHNQDLVVWATLIGFTDGQNMDATLTREQAATMIMRAVNMVNHVSNNERGTFNFEVVYAECGGIWVNANGVPKTQPRAETLAVIQGNINAPRANFNDMAQVSNEDAAGVNFVSANNIMGDVGGNTFDPKGLVSIERAIVSIYNIGRVDPLDTASGWARDGIASALAKGFVPADIQNNYTNVITRQEFCRMAISWVEYVLGKDIDTILSERGLSRNNPFSDTNDPYIIAAFALGITNGTSATTFTPDGQFSREQAATMIMNTCRAIGANVSNPPTSDFVDLDIAAPWARDGINFVRANGIMGGTSTTTPTFSPRGTFTRQESIVTFDRIVHSELPGR
jgi:hypothetical protein